MKTRVLDIRLCYAVDHSDPLRHVDVGPAAGMWA